MMAYVIVEPCIDVKDGACVHACPVNCIEGSSSDRQLYIDPERCVDCDVCVTVCPVDAIYPENKVPEKWRHFVAMNSDYFVHGGASSGPATGAEAERSATQI